MLDPRPITLEQKKELAKNDLRNLLASLGIKSADLSDMERALKALTKALTKALEAGTYGKPDQLFVSPHTFESLSKILK
jgi:hypothetical protein